MIIGCRSVGRGRPEDLVQEQDAKKPLGKGACDRSLEFRCDTSIADNPIFPERYLVVSVSCQVLTTCSFEQHP